MSTFKQKVESNPVIAILVAATSGFAAGFGAYQSVLSIGTCDVVKAGSYVMKSDVVGKLRRHEAVKEMEHLIEIGGRLRDSPEEAEKYMLRVHTFVDHLDLPKTIEIGGDLYSSTERTIHYIIHDIPNTGDPALSSEKKVARIVGILVGLKSALNSRVE